MEGTKLSGEISHRNHTAVAKRAIVAIIKQVLSVSKRPTPSGDGTKRADRCVMDVQ